MRLVVGAVKVDAVPARWVEDVGADAAGAWGCGEALSVQSADVSWSLGKQHGTYLASWQGAALSPPKFFAE
jgi:hypothetical protein